MATIGAGSAIGGLTGSGAISRLLVVLSAETSGLSRGLAGATGSLSSFASKANQIGSTLTRSLTLPILALGGVALKLASDYAAAIGRVQGLTTVLEDGRHTVADVTAELETMSVQTGTSIIELADSFYFAGSAGLNFQTAMDVVNESAKAAAIGMGDAKDVAKVLIFALNAYKGTGLDAAHATDVLVEGIKRGTAEPEEMAIALGRVIPVARDAGIAFDTVVASIAALTNIGLPTRVATTSLRALFTELLAPTIQATQTLESFGITAQDMRDVLMTGGPIAAFKLLEDATNGNVDALHDIIPQIRGFTAFTGLSGDALKEYKKTIEEVTHSEGAMDKAFGIIQKTPRFKFEQGINRLRIGAIKMGNVLIPIFEKLMSVVGDFGDSLANMPDIFKTITVGAGLALAALGPLLKIFGTLAVSGRVSLAQGIKGVTTALGLAAISAGIAAGAFSSLSQGSFSLSSVLSFVIGGVAAVALALNGVKIAAEAGMLGVSRFSTALAGLSGGWIFAIAVGITAIGLAVASVMSASKQYAKTVDETSTALTNAAQSGQSFRKTLESLKNREVADTFEKIAKSLSLLNKPVMEALPMVVDRAKTKLLQLNVQFQKFLGGLAGNPLQDFLKLGSDFQAGQTAIRLITKQGYDVGTAFKASGTSVNEFLSGITNEMPAITGLTTEQTDKLLKYKDSYESLFTAIESGQTTTKQYKKDLKAQLLATSLNDEETQRLADHFGVSTEFMQSSLDNLGRSALEIGTSGKDGIAAFGNAAFGGFGKAAAKAAEAQAAIDELNKSMTEALSGNLGLFDKFDKKVKKSTEAIVSHAEDAAKAALKQAENAQTLISRGVPAGLVEELIGQGPQMLQKFVDGTPKLLDRMVTAYQIRLGSIDAAIVKEGDHQKEKGKDMVSGFVDSILSKEGITRQAGHKIVDFVAGGLTRGTIKPGALGMIEEFVNIVEASGLPKVAGSRLAANFITAVGNKKPAARTAAFELVKNFAVGIQASGLPEQKANQAIAAVIQALNKNQGAVPAGAGAAQKFASGIASKAGASRIEAGIIVASVQEALRAARDGAYGSGAAVGAAFAAGIASGTAAAINAARQLANEARGALNQGLTNSPQYFTYYAGQDLVHSLHEGVKKGLRDHGPIRIARDLGSFGAGRTQRQASGRRSGNSSSRLTILTGDITIDGMDSRMRIVAREEAVGELSYRGM